MRAAPRNRRRHRATRCSRPRRAIVCSISRMTRWREQGRLQGLLRNRYMLELNREYGRILKVCIETRRLRTSLLNSLLAQYLQINHPQTTHRSLTSLSGEPTLLRTCGECFSCNCVCVCVCVTVWPCSSSADIVESLASVRAYTLCTGMGQGSDV